MKFYPSLYVAPSIEKKSSRIIWKLKCNAGTRNVYLLTLASNGKDLFDIIDAAYVKQKPLRRNLPMIIGLASSHQEAVEMVIGIIEETLRETGGVDVRQYLKNKIKKEG